jgi:hypothetical protein
VFERDLVTKTLPSNDFNDDFIPKSFLEEAHVAILDAHKELGEAQSVCEKLLYKCRDNRQNYYRKHQI